MKTIDKYFAYIFGFVFLFSLVSDWYRVLTVILLVLVFLFAIDKMGRGIVMRELISLHLIVVCLMMPLIGYVYFNQSNHLARVWVRYMFVPEDTYFSFALPACSGFISVLCWPMNTARINDFSAGIAPLIERAKKLVSLNNWVGPYLVALGVIMFFVSNALPIQLQFVFYLFYFAAFAGFLYVYYDRTYRYRNFILFGFVFYIIVQSLSSGMFTIVAYMGITMSSFLFLNRHFPLYKKVLVVFAGIFLLFLIQSVKLDYRRVIWKGDYTGSKFLLYGELLANKLSLLDDIETEKLVFPIYYRTNQGFNVSLVMTRFPRVMEHDQGKKLGRDIASTFVPRVLWPDKPEAGGKENMNYYAGVNLRGYSTNVGPLGEAYGAFGKYGGIVYMMALALFIRWSYRKVFEISHTYPLVMFWLPVLYYQVSYSSEADSLQILNSLLKAAFFMWILYKMFPVIFGIVKKNGKIIIG